MIHLFINALAASAGGGLTYIRNVLPRLAFRDDVRTTVLLTGHCVARLQNLPALLFCRKIIPQAPLDDSGTSNVNCRT